MINNGKILVDKCKHEIDGDRTRLLAHPLYGSIDTKEKLCRFMESHVFAVWDFMSLLKRLQNDFTCTRIPWTYVEDSETARVINDIVLSEESDVSPDGSVNSHMELYLYAMNEIGADTEPFILFHERVRSGMDYIQAMEEIKVPEFVRKFVTTTLTIAEHGKTSEVLGNFLFSREDLIPEMFTSLLKSWGIDKKEVPAFAYYLDRHIELDGDEHGPAATIALERLIERNPEEIDGVIRSTHKGIQARYDLWSGILEMLKK